MAARPTAAEMELRYAEVEKLLNLGYSFTALKKYAFEKWKIKGRMVQHYLKTVKGRISESLDVDLKKERAVAIQQREELYIKAYQKEDYRTALAILDSIAKIKGVNTDTLYITGGIADVTEEDIKKIHDDMIKELGIEPNTKKTQKDN